MPHGNQIRVDPYLGAKADAGAKRRSRRSGRAPVWLHRRRSRTPGSRIPIEPTLIGRPVPPTSLVSLVTPAIGRRRRSGRGSGATLSTSPGWIVSTRGSPGASSRGAVWPGTISPGTVSSVAISLGAEPPAGFRTGPVSRIARFHRPSRASPAINRNVRIMAAFPLTNRVNSCDRQNLRRHFPRIQSYHHVAAMRRDTMIFLITALQSEPFQSSGACMGSEYNDFSVPRVACGKAAGASHNATLKRKRSTHENSTGCPNAGLRRAVVQSAVFGRATGRRGAADARQPVHRSCCSAARHGRPGVGQG